MGKLVLKKAAKNGEDVKGEKIDFTKDSFVAVKGLKGNPFFEGQTKIVHKVHADNLVASKLAEIVKEEIVEAPSKTRTVKDAEEK